MNIRISLDLDKELFEEFSIKCIRAGKRKSDVLRQLVRDFLKNG